ncbi:MAG: hypothetical protein HC915_19190, partial [Anaerolineae bacterium]|nr:hypothetical protein [Anaerolineae bacterium]
MVVTYDLQADAALPLGTRLENLAGIAQAAFADTGANQVDEARLFADSVALSLGSLAGASAAASS